MPLELTLGRFYTVNLHRRVHREFASSLCVGSSNVLPNRLSSDDRRVAWDVEVDHTG
ncbi:Uncharacterised protein [Vibrio cholerae]|nr:Uncharacterised protein [Vibrio cholerae]